MRILSIGNSFSQDATRYLSQIAKADNENILTANLYIGGCSLHNHYINVMENMSKYNLEINGVSSGFFVSIKQALISGKWDYITVQQVSHESPFYETYQPYLTFIADYIRKYQPNTKILMHQTWAYEDNSKRLCDELGYKHSYEMFQGIEASYEAAAKAIDAFGIIPCGKAFQMAVESDIKIIHRDTFHAKLGIGRYLLGLVWYKYLTGNSVLENNFCDFDEPVTESEIKTAKAIATKVNCR